ncbi:molybdate transport system permease protein [Mobilisporobacter senegalensis]|uniref:Molybdenum transport system permease n=1 Tax=Mobilisporobacter senegalensis TaxID=1329262 RepID=A0A3N1XP39_9FIRM|nr:molybdate ABC transporter permease subunit [Mobilisporobacter senegalensis]ROR28460.1 molybdate transport system permease protein [Mobilisporobacter senegalensis]
MDFSPLYISMKTAIFSTLITFLLGIFAARKVMNMNEKISWFFDELFTLPLVLPPTVAGFLLLIIFGKNGMIGKVFEKIGVEIVFTWEATVLAAVVISFPLMYRSAKGAFEQVDLNLIYAGRTLGISEFKIFCKIVMPLALPGIVSGGILAFARALGEFGATIMIAGNIPGITQTMPVAIYMAVQGNNMEVAAMWVGIIIVIAFLAIILMNFVTHKNRSYIKKG